MAKERIADELILPEHQNYRAPALARRMGLALRLVLVLWALFSLSLMVADAVTAPISPFFILAASLAAMTVGAAMSISPRFFAGGIVGFSIAGALAFTFVESFAGIAVNSFYSAVNLWQKRLSDCGYIVKSKPYDLSEFMGETGFSEELLVSFFFSAAILTAGILLSLCVLKKVRIYPTLVILSFPTAVCLYFGLCENNLPLAFVLSSFCGITSLFCYDKLYVSRRNIKSSISASKSGIPSHAEIEYTAKINSYLGGYGGFAAALLSLLLLLPFMGINKGMTDIPKISRPAAKAEMLLSSLVNSGGRSMSGLFFSGSIPADKVTTKAENLKYTGKSVLEVYSPVNIPVYLRNWVGIDYYEDGWHTASPDRIADYRAKFGGGFTPEFLTSELLRMVDPSLIELPEDKKLVRHSSLGYITAPIYINKHSATSALVLAPSYANQKIGLLKYGSRKSELFGYSNYYDGIFSSTAYIFMDKYGMVSQIPHYTDEDFAKNIGILVKYYTEQCDVITEARQMIAEGKTDDEIKKLYYSKRFTSFAPLSDGYSFPTGQESVSYRYIFEMSRDERLWINAILDNLYLYYSYVYDNYLSSCESSAELKALMVRIMEESDISRRGVSSITGNLSYSEIYDRRHQTVMALNEYLRENMTYTLSPKAPSEDRPYTNGIDSFLFDTKEGYCVQYATAAVMMLRSVGIPARYAQGYVAEDFIRSYGDSPEKYKTTVRDSDAHAWIEVYYDFYGWVQYEVTFSDNGEGNTDTEVNPADTLPPPDSDNTTSADTDTTSRNENVTSGKTDTTDITNTPPKNPQEQIGRMYITTVVIITVVAAAVVTAVVIVIKSRMAAVNQKYTQLREISPEYTAEEIVLKGKLVGDAVMKILESRGISPMTGERWENFSNRAEILFSGVYDGLSTIQKCEFSGSISLSELEALITCFDRLFSDTLKGKGKIRGFVFKYFLLLH